MTYREEAIKLAQDLHEQQGRVATHRDPNLTEQGLAEKRSAATRSLREAAVAQSADLARRMEARRFMARLAADKARPRVKEEPAALIRMQQKWEQVRGLLDSGREIRAVIKSADLDTLLAIEEFAPAYLQSKADRPTGLEAALAGVADDAPDLRLPIERRIAELTPGEVATKLLTAHQTEQDVAAAQPYIDHVSEFGTRGATSSDMLNLTVAEQMGTAPYRVPRDVEAEPAGLDSVEA